MQNHRRVPLIVILSIFTALGTSIIFIRFWVRLRIFKSVSYDDYFIFLAWAASIGFTVASSISIKQGVGLFAYQVTPSDMLNIFETTFVVEMLYFVCIYLIKMSILSFYHRLPKAIRGKFWAANLILIGIITAQFISTILITLLHCRPISYNWDQSKNGTCIGIKGFYLSTCIFTIVTDVVIILLPIPTLVATFRSTPTRLALLAIFLAGTLSTIASGVRVYALIIFASSHDPVYNAAPINLWSFIEINLGFVCASGSALKQLYLHFKPPNTDFDKTTLKSEA